MGRPRKPLSEQVGNLTQQQKTELEYQENLITVSQSELLVPPKWLISLAAKKEYKRIISLLNEIDMLGDLDINNLGGYCNAFAMYLKITKELSKAPLITIGGNGQDVENPLINTQKKYASEMRDFARLCGLTIDSRLKFAAIKSKEISTDIEDEFGDI